MSLISILHCLARIPHKEVKHAMTYLDDLPPIPFRPPDRRWGVTHRLREGGHRPRRFRPARDPRVRRVSKFPSRSAGAGEVPDRLVRRDPGVAAASALRVRAAPRERWEVEARPLAARSDDAITSRCGRPAGVVAAYEASFDDVRAMRGAPERVVLTGIGPGDPTGRRRTGATGRVGALILSNSVKPRQAGAHPGERLHR
jgi:hypothetical protein